MKTKYHKNLKKQFDIFKDWDFSGHAPHGANNYICFGNNRDFLIIEMATINSGFKWVSNYRLIRDTLAGSSFGEPVPVYILSRSSKDGSVLVFSPAWDDKFLKRTYYTDAILGSKARSFSEAQDEILTKMEICRKNNMPFILNLHPDNWLNRGLQGDKIISWLKNYCVQNEIRIISHNQFYCEITKNLCT